MNRQTTYHAAKKINHGVGPLISQVVNEGLRRKGITQRDLAEKVYRSLGCTKPQTAEAYLSRVRHGLPYGSSGLAAIRNIRNVYRLEQIFYALEIDEHDPTLEIIKFHDPRLRYP